jgi:vanillate/3-O-methylgallate O-demethylase
MNHKEWKEQYLKANQWGKGAQAFIDRPMIGSPAAPAQAETNASNIWGHINAGYLIGYEYTRWWKESWALRNTAIVGDWSWLNKTMVRGPDASRFINYATVRDTSKQQVGQILYTPMVNGDGKIAIEGLTLKFSETEYMFSQSAGFQWLSKLLDMTRMRVELEDVTADFTCYALQGPCSTDILEALTGESFRDLRFSRWRKTRILDTDVIISRQGVTGEVGYEFLMPTASGKAHELWRRIREVGRDFELRELGFKTQQVGHTETGIATVIRDFLPARMPPYAINKFARNWMAHEELDAIDYDMSVHFCSPAELGWAHTIKLENHDFFGRDALAREADAGGPSNRLMGLEWNSDDMAELYAALFRDGPSAPPPDLPYGQFRILFLRVFQGNDQVGWASGIAYSPNVRRMISLSRIRKDLAKQGTEVSVLWGGFSTEPSVRIRARVVELPFIKQHRTNDLSMQKQ